MTIFEQAFDPATDRALVTGAGNGIGRAIALALIAEGVPTVFADIKPETVEAAISGSANPKLANGWVGDLAERSECDRLLKDAGQVLGTITHFIHSAAPPRREADHVLSVLDETWVRMRAVNVDAGFHLGREISKALIAAKLPGSLLYLTSLHAQTPRNLPHYSTAKAAMTMMVKEFAKSLGRYQIRVNALVPGAIVAGGFVADPKLARHIPLGRLGKSDDLAALALAVLSNKISGYVTGAEIVIDGGISLTNWFEAPVFDPS
jgi:3-oxoacyl-[acyl-carrier protein] reductase